MILGLGKKTKLALCFNIINFEGRKNIRNFFYAKMLCLGFDFMLRF